MSILINNNGYHSVPGYEQPQYYPPQPQNKYPPQIPLENYPQYPSHHHQVCVEADIEVSDNQGSDDNFISLILLILGFFFGFPWLICTILYSKSKSANARSYAKISLILFIVSIAIVLIIFILFIISIAASGAIFGSIFSNASKHY
ncbi:hypothetical protein ACTA71_010440 [Dictyostelium dimigraforme]